MSSLIGKLSQREKSELLKDLYYLNTAELSSFCDRNKIPYKILIETESGKLRTTRDKDRKKIIIQRITNFLKTGNIADATVFANSAVDLSGLPANIGEDDRIFYGCYDKKNPKMIALLKDLTGGKFKNGAVARILLREFWANGKAPTFSEFAKVWLKAKKDYSLDQHPEAAYLTDLRKGTAGNDWKKIRNEKARKVMRILGRL
ncbi:MAG: hypothetical protein R2681_09110 [Pyrinomonadaceae bacterium]